jgi:hypothetical protein
VQLRIDRFLEFAHHSRMLRIVAALKRRSTFDDPAPRGLAARLAG